MAEGDACLLDSNILLRISKRDDPHHPVIAQALKTLVGQGVRLCYTSRFECYSPMSSELVPVP
jgi:hypothetical protein